MRRMAARLGLAALVVAVLALGASWRWWHGGTVPHAGGDDLVREALASGVDFTRPVTVRFDWRPVDAPPSGADVQAVLQAAGFEGTGVAVRHDGGATRSARWTATRTGPWTAERLAETVRTVDRLVDAPETVSWSIEQGR